MAIQSKNKVVGLEDLNKKELNKIEGGAVYVLAVTGHTHPDNTKCNDGTDWVKVAN